MTQSHPYPHYQTRLSGESYVFAWRENRVVISRQFTDHAAAEAWADRLRSARPDLQVDAWPPPKPGEEYCPPQVKNPHPLFSSVVPRSQLLLPPET